MSLMEFIIIYVVFTFAISIYIGLKSLKKIEPGEIGLWTVRGEYKDILRPGYNVIFPLVSKVKILDYNDYTWKQKLRKIANKYDMSNEEIQNIKETLKEVKEEETRIQSEEHKI